ncbi:MAG: RDD family protein [Chloroflexota bacterium]
MDAVNVDWRIAPVKKRLIAFAWDYLWMSLYIIILASVSTGLLFATGRNLLQNNPILWDFVSFLTLILPVICYFALQESSSQRGTWGKKRAGIVVVNSHGGQLTRGQAFSRAIVKFIPWQIAHTSIFQIEGWPLNPQDPSIGSTAGLMLVWILVGVYFAAMVFSKSRRTPYDWAVGSIVVLE